ncbi:MAG: hypothetical protein U1F30_12910 [Steroidobacteraceae bacterium]
MASLRWILLLAGLLFIAGLALWERRRPRQARGAGLPDADGGAVGEDSAAAEAPAVARVAAGAAARARSRAASPIPMRR